jgi:cytochrome d ubiquinol oxidase subunit II
MLITVWFLLWGLLWAMFFITDGFNLGLASLLPVFAKNENERKEIISTMSPFWDPNQVWFISAGGMTFAVFPVVYATLFSSLYAAFMIVLFALIFRAVAFEFRNKSESPSWIKFWHTLLVLGSLIPAIIFGVLFGNLFRGLPIDETGVYQGTFFTLLNPYAVFCGILFLAMFSLHGLIWLGVKSTGELHARAVSWAKKMWIVFLIVLVFFLVWSYFATGLYKNYFSQPTLLILPILVVVFLLVLRTVIAKTIDWSAFIASAFTILFTTFFTLVGLFPNIVPSTINPSYSLNIHNSSSSPTTLTIMLITVIIFIPIILAYQVWAYVVLNRKPFTGPQS